MSSIGVTHKSVWTHRRQFTQHKKGMSLDCTELTEREKTCNLRTVQSLAPKGFKPGTSLHEATAVTTNDCRIPLRNQSSLSGLFFWMGLANTQPFPALLQGRLTSAVSNCGTLPKLLTSNILSATKKHSSCFKRLMGSGSALQSGFTVEVLDSDCVFLSESLLALQLTPALVH